MYDKEKYTLITCPGQVETVSVPSSVTGIGREAFYKGSLKSITIPPSVTKIGDMAFEECENLKSIVFPDSVKNYGVAIFENCISLENITLSNSAYGISHHEFYKCRNLQSITIPDIVIYIDKLAFGDCTSLISITIPKSVTEIADDAFEGCNKNLIIICEKDSYAEKYAKEHGIPCQYIDEENTQTITAKDFIKTYGDKAFFLGAKTNGGGKLTYKVSNTKIATIDKKGKVTIKGCGRTQIKITAAAKGKYKKTTKTITLTVKPKKATVASVKSTNPKSLTVQWKQDKTAKGYIIQYSTDKNFKKSVKTVTVSKNKTTSKTISKLKGGKKYYVRVCAYTTADGKKIKGNYSNVINVKVKK